MSKLIDVCIIVDSDSQTPVLITTSDKVENGLFANSFIKEKWHLDFRYWFIQADSRYDIQIIETIESAELWVKELYIGLFDSWGICLINSHSGSNKLVQYSKKVGQYFEKVLNKRLVKIAAKNLRTGWSQYYPVIHLLKNSCQKFSSLEIQKKRFVDCLIEIVKLKVVAGFSDEIILKSYANPSFVTQELLKSDYSKSFYEKKVDENEINIEVLSKIDRTTFQYLVSNARLILLNLEFELRIFFSQPVDLDFSFEYFFLEYRRHTVIRLFKVPLFVNFMSYIFELYELKNLYDLDELLNNKFPGEGGKPSSQILFFWKQYNWFVTNTIKGINPNNRLTSYGKKRWLKYNKDQYIKFYNYLDAINIIDAEVIESIRNRYY